MRDELLPSERCDRCGAQAYVQWTNRLLFCAHHNREHEAALKDADEAIVADMRHRLTDAPSGLVDAE